MLGLYILLRVIKSERKGVRMVWDCHASSNIPSLLTSFATRFLKWAYDVTTASLRRAEEEVLDRDSGCKYKVSRDFFGFPLKKNSHPFGMLAQYFLVALVFLSRTAGILKSMKMMASSSA